MENTRQTEPIGRWHTRQWNYDTQPCECTVLIVAADSRKAAIEVAKREGLRTGGYIVARPATQSEKQQYEMWPVW